MQHTDGEESKAASERVAGDVVDQQMGKKGVKAKVTTQRGKEVRTTTVLFVEFRRA